jgi:hypothetical protein
MKSEVISLPSLVGNGRSSKFWPKIVKDGASQFQNFPANFHESHALFSTRLSLLSYTITSFAQDEFRKFSRVRRKHRELLQFGFILFKAIPKGWRRISQSHRTSKR